MLLHLKQMSIWCRLERFMRGSYQSYQARMLTHAVSVVDDGSV